MEYLSFRHGQQHYAVPVANVRFITADTNLQRTRVATGDGQQRDMVDFDGNPCVVLSLAKMLGQASAHTAARELTELLHARERDHVDWLEALDNSLRNHTEFTLARDPKLCAFGLWRHSFQSDNQVLMQLLEKFDTPHQRIHALADELLQLQEDGQAEQALSILEEHKRTTLNRLRSLFEDARQMVSSSVRPTVIMIQNDQQQVVGLKVDDIGEVFSCDHLQQDLSANDYLPEFGEAWLKDIDLSEGKTTVMQLNPNRLMH